MFLFVLSAWHPFRREGRCWMAHPNLQETKAVTSNHEAEKMDWDESHPCLYKIVHWSQA